MDRYEQRRINVLRLRDDLCGGKASELAEKLRRAPSYVSRMLYPEGKEGKKRIAESMARLLEKTFELTSGWLDKAHGQPGDGSYEDVNQQRQITVPNFKFQQDGKSALHLPGQLGTIQSWQVTPEWIQETVRNYSKIENLAIVTAFGDSMSGLFNAGDPILVDRGATAVSVDSIYVFRVGTEGFIKRIQRVPGIGLLVISENPTYREWVITPDMDFEVFARVIKVWRSREI